MQEKNANNKFKTIVETILFGSKWLLIPFYLGLMVAMVIYMFIDIKEVIHMVHNGLLLNSGDGMMILLELVDMAMIANLVKMIISGSYTSFVEKVNYSGGEKASSSALKVKMATSMVGVSSIHLLQTFIEAKFVTNEILYRQLMIHVAFLVGALVLVIIEYLHTKAELMEHQMETHENPSIKHKKQLLTENHTHETY